MKLERLLAITLLLLNRRRISARELAERFEVSLRTIYRDLEAINAAGIPVASHKGTSGGYEIMETYRLERQFLTAEEMEALAAAVKGFGHTWDERDLERVLTKVGALLDRHDPERLDRLDEQVKILRYPWERPDHDRAGRDRLNVLRKAVQRRNCVDLVYLNKRGERMERTVEPVGLVLKGDVWYVYAYCRMRRDYRIFRLSRIHRLTVRDETFERKAVTLEQIDERWYQMDPPSSFIRLVLRFSPEVRVRVEDFFGMDRIREMEDDSLIVTFRCPEGPWTYEMLLKFGTHVEVLEPAHVRHKLRETALQIARKYGTE